MTTAIRSVSIAPASAITWLIRRPVPSSMPLARLTTMAPPGICHWARLARSDWDGTARTTKSAPSITSSGSLPARRVSGKAMVGK